jgi:hypothetical protein
MLATFPLFGAMITPAAAVTHGTLDGNGHPFVGLMVAKDADGAPLWRCTGTLLSDRLFLTAGHCTEAPAASAEIWFSSGPVPLGDGYPAAGDDRCAGITGYPCTGDVSGTTYTHPQYDPDAFFLYDLGVVLLDAPVTMAAYGELPALNQLEGMKPGPRSAFTSVGYGLQRAFPDAAAWKEEADRIRMVAYPQLLQINVPGFTGDGSLLLSNNAKTGGTCFGDSGGPNFARGTNVVAAVTSFGISPTCGGTGGVYRVDRADDLDWLYDDFGAYLP